MDASERKRLIEEYKYRKTQIGVFSVQSGVTGEKFPGRSKDIPADDHSKELEELFEKCLAEDPRALKIWR